MTANSLHPGFVATRFTAKSGRVFWAMRQLARLVALTPEAGAQTSIYLATSPEVEDVSGRYFAKSRPSLPTPAARDAEAARNLWHLSETMTGLPISE